MVLVAVGDSCFTAPATTSTRARLTTSASLEFAMVLDEFEAGDVRAMGTVMGPRLLRRKAALRRWPLAAAVGGEAAEMHLMASSKCQCFLQGQCESFRQCPHTMIKRKPFHIVTPCN
jgi:hypothetical protein